MRPRRWLGAAAAALAVAAVLTALALWPAAAPPPAPAGGGVVLGTVADFPPGSVTAVERPAAFVDRLPLEHDVPAQQPPVRRPNRLRVIVTNAPDGLHAFLARSPFAGCLLRPAAGQADGFALADGVDPDLVAVLDPCHGGLFALDGAHLGGAGRRGLDGFPVTVGPDGQVLVDLAELGAGR